MSTGPCGGVGLSVDKMTRNASEAFMFAHSTFCHTVFLQMATRAFFVIYFSCLRQQAFIWLTVILQGYWDLFLWRSFKIINGYFHVESINPVHFCWPCWNSCIMVIRLWWIITQSIEWWAIKLRFLCRQALLLKQHLFILAWRWASNQLPTKLFTIHTTMNNII